ncbi:hypothetical protein MKX01_030011 [Papaver californicum]|nr:hypothetical protein MKX01_030011 [Papaver californicum]
MKKKNTKVNLIHFLSALSFSSLLLTVSALTDSTDAEAIDLLKTTFPLLGLTSTGDPCLPTPYLWVQCSSHFTPRIVALNLHDSLLITDSSLPLPDFSAMDALEIIDLSDNVLQGEFPDFLANFPDLKVLNLANNFLTGTVPTSLRDKSKANTLKLTLTGVGMPPLCFSDGNSCSTKTGRVPETPGTGTGSETPGTGSGASPGVNTGFTPKPTKSGNKKLPSIALGIGIPTFLILCAIVTFLAIDHQKKKAMAEATPQGKTNEISGLAMPVNADTEQQMHPTVNKGRAI